MLGADGVVEWIPWNKIMSVDQETAFEKKMKTGDTPAPKLHTIFGSMMASNPSLEDSELSSAPVRFSRMFQVLRNAFAMCAAGHLPSFKLLNGKMVEYLTIRYSPGFGLRNPNRQELMDGDRHVWEEMCKLVRKHHFLWDDVFYEFTGVRGNWPFRLGQRLRARKPKALVRTRRGAPHIQTDKGRSTGEHLAGRARVTDGENLPAPP